MRKAALSTVATVVTAFVVTLSSQALAQEPAPPPAEAPKPAPAPAAAADPAAPKPSGVTLDMAFGLGVMGGQLVDHVDLSSVQSTFALKLGMYVTQHVGFSAAFQGGYGTMNNGFDDAYEISIPLRVEYAWKDRFRGAYVEGGISPMNKLGAYTDTSKGKDPATLDASSSLDYGLGVGYRIPFTFASMDLHAGFDWGQYSQASVHTVDGDAGGTIDSASQATHWTVNLGVAYRFGTH